MNRYIEIPADRLKSMLEGAGFLPFLKGSEVVYRRQNDHDPRCTVDVYSSCRVHDETARECGEDAIRVIATFTWLHRESGQHRTKKLHQQKILRVNSVDGVLTRTINAARDAYKATNQFIRASHEKNQRKAAA